MKCAVCANGQMFYPGNYELPELDYPFCANHEIGLRDHLEQVVADGEKLIQLEEIQLDDEGRRFQGLYLGSVWEVFPDGAHHEGEAYEMLEELLPLGYWAGSGEGSGSDFYLFREVD